MSDQIGWIGSRQLLRRLRDAMAGGGSVEERLDLIVDLIARGMVAEVCSIYVLRPGDLLVLYATEGLRKDAVHRTRLRVGEGLVGAIAARAQPLALADAQKDPGFAYRPETGEEIYHSLAGVPILRGSRVRGVLVVQNRTQRDYTEEEIETLETVAMVLAELISGTEAVGVAMQPADGTNLVPLRLAGASLSRGMGMGRAVLHRQGTAITRVVGEDPEAELARFDEAIEGMRSQIDRLLAAHDDDRSGRGRRRGAGEHVDILRTYRRFADDRGWIGRIREAIQSGLTAEAAVSKVQNDLRVRMQAVGDDYIRERLQDLDDLAFRLLQHLTGDVATPELPEDAVIVARSMGPAELLDYDHRRIRGVLLEEGSPSAHVAIVARAFGIPAVGNLVDVFTKVEQGDLVLLDGDNGIAAIRPGEHVRQRFTESLEARLARQATYAASRNLPAITRDGVEITLQINAGLAIDLEHLQDSGAAGVGLYRTEIPFMVQSGFPDVRGQTQLYQRVLDLAEGRPVVFRTLDIGGDKLLPYFRGAGDENPALGWRAIRISLDRPAMLRQQLRALIRAAHGRDLDVMFPMVAEVAELVAARALLDREQIREAGRGVIPGRIRVGVMLEVPALLFQLPALLPRIDFLSIGSNDLQQFLFASDRGNPRVGNRYDALAPALLAIVKRTVDACHAAGVPVGLCGEMAGNPLEAMALVGLGLRRLSMPPASIGAVRTMIRSLDAGALAHYLGTLPDSPEHSIRGRLRAFAQDHGVQL
ncbi:MAG: phosphoenolpyruvate--protein phosphotransferase [Alphaproteobacteria bacterium]